MSPSYQCGIGEVALTADAIQRRVAELSAQIAGDYAGQTPTVVGVMKSSMVFLSDLIRGMDMPMRIDTVALSSYEGSESSGDVRFTKRLDSDISGCDIILIEDIVDTGLSLRRLMPYIKEQRPASVAVCALLNKTAHRAYDIHIDYVGFDIEDAFVIGYGMDYNGLYRNLPYIAAFSGGGETA